VTLSTPAVGACSRPSSAERAARSLHGEALRAVLHDEARGRRRAGFRRHQAVEVRGVVTLRSPDAAQHEAKRNAAPLIRGP